MLNFRGQMIVNKDLIFCKMYLTYLSYNIYYVYFGATVAFGIVALAGIITLLIFDCYVNSKHYKVIENDSI